MNSSVSAQALTERTVIETFDKEFARLYVRFCRLIDATAFETLYVNPLPGPESGGIPSVGELVLRSAGVVEQTFGGLTSNLWDDPFEWTLPETLSTKDLIREYLAEVEDTRKRAFVRFLNDGNLLKLIAVPDGDPTPLVGLLLDTLARASDYQGRATLVHGLLRQT